MWVKFVMLGPYGTHWQEMVLPTERAESQGAIEAWGQSLGNGLGCSADALSQLAFSK
jgi:hypothetical protein